MPDITRCSETDELHVRRSCAIYPTLECASPLLAGALSSLLEVDDLLEAQSLFLDVGEPVVGDARNKNLHSLPDGKPCPIAPIGTTLYRAPELLLQSGAEISHHRFNMDVYSFAITCYEVVTGRIPFDGHDLVIDGARPELPDHVPGKMTLIPRCWQADPNSRPRVLADAHMHALQAQCGYKGPPFPSFESEHKLLQLAMGMKGSHELGVGLKVLLQVAMGMKALHEGHIYHRDLKAANVLVTRHSHPDSKPCPISELHITDCERSEDVLGTGFYRAPEEDWTTILGGPQVPESTVGVKSFILNDDEPARKRCRTLDLVAENLPEKYRLDRASNSFSSEDEGLSGDSMATVESQAEDTADSHVPQTNQSHQLGSETNSNFANKKRSAATVYEDDLMSSIALFVNKQIEEALKPLLSVLQSREEEQKHREKLLAIEEEKLALKREKMLFTQCMLANSNCFQF